VGVPSFSKQLDVIVLPFWVDQVIAEEVVAFIFVELEMAFRQ